MILDLFAGAGGWDVGARMAGLSDPLGVETDNHAVDTRAANGFHTVHQDVTDLDPRDFADVEGLIASPPCPDFSVAGNKSGLSGASGWLTNVVPDWVDAIRPRWVACEQVPPVLPIWREHAHRYRAWGYQTWTGVLNAADYGVPQTRPRAILIARLDGPALPPEPTHAKHPQPAGMFDGGTLPWVGMADALGWTDQGAWILNAGDHWARPMPTRSVDNPAPTLAFGNDYRSWKWERPDGDPLPVSPSEMSTLQSFPSCARWSGREPAQFKQIGNAVPPLLARRILEAVA